MLRAFLHQPTESATVIILDKEESHHLTRVRRARSGEPVEVLNGRGTRWQCEYEGLQGHSAILRIITREDIPAPACRVTLAQGLPLGKTMDTIVQKATELGIVRIIPLFTNNSEVRLDGDRAESKVEKYRNISIEACKQCGSVWLPEISPPQSLATFLASASSSYDVKFVAALTPKSIEMRPALDALPVPPVEACWLVGPEGDFSPQEYESILSHKWTAITLGPNVLRSDTAAVSALSVLLYELRLRSRI